MTKKEKLFCRFYATYQLPKEAAIKAGYAENIAEKKANYLLNRPDVQQDIKKRKNEADKQQLEQWAITALRRMLFSNNDAILLALKSEQLTEKQIENLNLFLISELKKFKDGSLEIKFFDKLKAINILLEIANNLQTSNEANSFLNALTNSTNNLAKNNPQDDAV